MLKIDGTPKINAVGVSEVTITAAEFPGVIVAAKFRLMNAESGQSFGGGDASGMWSDGTKKLLNELLKSMEQDIGAIAFTVQESTNSVPVEEEPPLDDTPGL